jgi:hypothetical protein
MTDDVKTVWILGSGFSAGLGGPLLNDLLSPSGKSKVLSRYESVRHEIGVVLGALGRHHSLMEIEGRAKAYAEAERLKKAESQAD